MAPTTKESRRLIIVHGKSGNLIVAGIERPVHRCPSLTKAEEIELLREAATELMSEPPDDAGS
jgi:hypothetical protein